MVSAVGNPLLSSEKQGAYDTFRVTAQSLAAASKGWEAAAGADQKRQTSPHSYWQYVNLPQEPDDGLAEDFSTIDKDVPRTTAHSFDDMELHAVVAAVEHGVGSGACYGAYCNGLGLFLGS